MSLPDFFFERVTSEIHQQMEGVLALADRLARHPLGADAQACVAGVSEAAACVRQILASTADLKDAATRGMASMSRALPSSRRTTTVAPVASTNISTTSPSIPSMALHAVCTTSALA